MNTSRTLVRSVPVDPPRRVAGLMLIGSAAGLIWLGAMIYTLAGWLF